MTTFGDDLIQALNEALAHAKGQGPGVVHAPATPVRSASRRSLPKRRWRH